MIKRASRYIMFIALEDNYKCLSTTRVFNVAQTGPRAADSRSVILHTGAGLADAGANARRAATEPHTQSNRSPSAVTQSF